jgi:hypothetical protein
VVVYFVGAIAAHLRVEDKKLAAPLAMRLAAVAVLVLRATTI